MIGQTVLHYKITREIGRGGMGVVYQAEDNRLGRVVALKFLPRPVSPSAEQRQRFEREARAAAALSHPNIAHVYAIEEADDGPFIVMEYVDGHDLSQFLSGDRPTYERVLEIGTQIAGALQAAHDRGIVHRDVKPANVIVTHDGRVKVMDFGLAKWAGDSQLTRSGTVMGTVDYMSPEQVRGDAVDQRTDIWSFGILLYELLSGVRPFAGESAQAVMYAIAHEAPRPLAAPHPELAALVARLIARRREDRPQSMAEVAAAIQQLKARNESPTRLASEADVARPRLPGLAVLPFASIRDDPETRFLGFALADQIITALSYAGGVAVRPSSAVRRYQQESIDAPTAGRELHVEFVLTGYYLKEAETIRLNVELVDARVNDLVWRETIQVKYENAFKLQDIVSDKVLRGLNVRFSHDGPGRRPADQPGDPEAYEYYLRALSYPVTLEGNQLAVRMLEVAIGRDARYAPAHAELGFRLGQVAMDAMLGHRGLRRAEEALQTALALNDELLPALWELSMFYVNTGRTHEAIGLVERLFRVAPDTALAPYVLGYVFRYAGLLEESAREIARALDLDPKHPRFRSAGFTYLYLGDYQRAYEVFDLNPSSSLSIGIQGIALLHMGHRTRAVEHFDRVIALEPESFIARRVSVVRAVVQGRSDEASRLMRAFDSVSASETDAEHWYLMGEVYGLLGDGASCARLLRKAVEGGFFCYPAMFGNPFMDAVRTESEVQRVLAEARLKHDEFKRYLLDKWGSRLTPIGV